jgi:hypothetical protein
MWRPRFPSISTESSPSSREQLLTSLTKATRTCKEAMMMGESWPRRNRWKWGRTCLRGSSRKTTSGIWGISSRLGIFQCLSEIRSQYKWSGLRQHRQPRTSGSDKSTSATFKVSRISRGKSPKTVTEKCKCRDKKLRKFLKSLQETKTFLT